MKQAGKQVYINIRRSSYEEVIKISKEMMTPRTSYLKYMLMDGLREIEEKGLYIYPAESKPEYEFLPIRLPDDVSERIKRLSDKYRISVPQLCGHIIEQELKKKVNQV